jgi:hypothetical protein
MRYIFSCWGEIAARLASAGGSRFLDFDGTLAISWPELVRCIRVCEGH